MDVIHLFNSPEVVGFHLACQSDFATNWLRELAHSFPSKIAVFCEKDPNEEEGNLNIILPHDYSDKKAEEIVSKLSRKQWLIPSEVDVTKIQLRLDSLIFKYEALNSTVYHIWEEYTIKSTAQKTNLIATWKDGQLSTPEPELWKRRSNLTGVTLKNVVLSTSDLIEYKVDPTTGEASDLTGTYADIFETMRQVCNFSVVSTSSPDGKWGAPMANGTWNGMVGVLQRLEADVSIAGLAITSEREEIIEFANGKQE